MAEYRVFGITIETDWSLQHNLIKANTYDPVTVRVTCSKPLPECNLVKENLLYQSPYKTATGETLLSVYKSPDSYILNYPNVVRFYLFPQKICYQPLEDFSHLQTENYLLSGVLAIWLELQGKVCLHASAVVVHQYGLAFLGNSGEGKTSLAMSMLQAGYSLLSDDILPVQQINGNFLGLPAFPTVRTWPDQSKHFIASPETLTRVMPQYEKRLLPIGTGTFGQFAINPVQLRCFYLLERSRAENKTMIEITPVPTSQALIELLKHSYAARATDGLGLSNQRLGSLVSLVRNVAMRKLVYPSGIGRLSEVRQAILEDFS